MNELILHHYDMSPYAEKVRLGLGLKDLAWRSVQIPVVMPKPDLTELTGGYRRTPTLQLGADLYCDTKIILRTLERLCPQPSLFPTGDEATTWGLSRWAETSFMMVVGAFFGLDGTFHKAFDKAFFEDRKKMAPDVDFTQAPKVLPAKLLQLRANLDILDRQLSDGRAFLLSDAPGLADLSAYHPHMMLRYHPVTAKLLEPLAHIPAWMERVEALGHGDRTELDSKEAIEIARAATPAPVETEPAALPDGLVPGDAVMVLPQDVGSGVVAGELLPTGVHEIAVRLQSDRAGDVVVHFPREDYLVVRA